MRGKHMTSAESEKLKRMMRTIAHTGIRMEDFYPQVEKIVIHHECEHRSFCGISHDEGTRTINPQNEVYFLLECQNRECTSAGFDLRDVVSSAIHSRQTEVTGEMHCEGQEAPDHPEQRCSGKLKYTIKIFFKQ